MTKEFLLIDDDVDEFEVFADALAAIDKLIKCTQVNSLSEAQEFLRHTIPGYIFIDFNMPQTNGVDCLRELKKLSQLDKSKIVLYSNFIGEEMKQEAISLGAYNCIKKPTTILGLSSKLREIMRS